MPNLHITVSYKNKMHVHVAIARVLANAYYGLDLYSGCLKDDAIRAARAITIHRAFVMGGIDDKGNLTNTGYRMLVNYRERKRKRDTERRAALAYDEGVIYT